MKTRFLHSFATSILAAAALTACSPDRSPLEPAASRSDAQFSTAVAGTYELTFHTTGYFAIGAGVDSVPVGSEVAIRANVRDAAGNLATTGSVTFERCEVDGVTAPSADCLSGAGRWKRTQSIRMDKSGYPPTGEGARCTSPKVIGFRFKYSGSGSGIASGMSAARDIKWYAPEPVV